MAAPIKSGQVALGAAVRNEADLLAILEPPTAQPVLANWSWNQRSSDQAGIGWLGSPQA